MLKTKCFANQCGKPIKQLENQAPYLTTNIVQAILKLRHQLGGIIGKSNFADYTTNRRMVKSGTQAHNFIQDMHEKFSPDLKKEYSNLKTFKNQRSPSPSPSSNNQEVLLEPWKSLIYVKSTERKLLILMKKP